jgi:hypothetical protein
MLALSVVGYHDFNKHDINILKMIFINEWRKYVGGDIRRLFNITRRFEQRENEVNFHKATFSPELPSNASPVMTLSPGWIKPKTNINMSE